jgi:hypothetical protein
LLLNALTSLIAALLRVLLEVSWFAKLLLIFPLFVKKSNSLASSS